MKKILIPSTLVFLLAITPTVVFAQKGNGAQNAEKGQGDQLQVRDPEEHDDTETPQGSGLQDGQGNQGVGTPTQNSNKQNTQNQGEDSRIQIMNEDGADLGSRGANKPNNRSDIARQRMSGVAQKVEDLLADGSLEGGIGQRVREFAQNQKQIQKQVENQYQQLKGRGRIMKFLFGEDKEALKESKELLGQNRQRVRELQDFLGGQLPEEQEAEIQGLIDSLSDQNAVLEDELDAEESTTGVLEWFTNLIN